MIYKLDHDYENNYSLLIDPVEMVNKMPNYKPRQKAIPIAHEWLAPDASFFKSENFTGSAEVIPDVTMWKLGYLVLSPNAYDKLKFCLSPSGEFLPITVGGKTFYLFSPLYIIADDAIDKDMAVDIIDSGVHPGQENVIFDESVLNKECMPGSYSAPIRCLCRHPPDFKAAHQSRAEWPRASPSHGVITVTTASKAKMAAFMAQFRADAGRMTFTQLTQEKHSSKRLGDFLRADGHARPGARWEAHHIVSGKHVDAMQSRALLADEEIQIRIDDPDNGCWMPKTKADARPTIYPNAIGHNRIHRELYYQWIYNAIFSMSTSGQARAFLNTVRMQLLQGNIKPELKIQQEIDAAEYESWLKKNRKL